MLEQVSPDPNDFGQAEIVYTAETWLYNGSGAVFGHRRHH